MKSLETLVALLANRYPAVSEARVEFVVADELARVFRRAQTIGEAVRRMNQRLSE